MYESSYRSAGALDITTVASFHPFDEINGSRIDVEPAGPHRWDITGFMRKADFHARSSVIEEDGDRSVLLRLPHVPAWVREWKGQYEILVRKVETVDDCGDVVQEPKAELDAEDAHKEILRLRGINTWGDLYGRNVRAELEAGYRAGVVPVEEVDRVAEQLEAFDRMLARALPTGPFGMDDTNFDTLVFTDSGSSEIGKLFEMDQSGFANDPTGATARMYGRYIVAALNAVRGVPLEVLTQLDGAVVEMAEVRELIKQGQTA